VELRKEYDAKYGIQQ